MTTRTVFFRLALFVFLLASEQSIAVSRSYIGPSGNGAWATATNWMPNGTPAAGDDITISVSSALTLNNVGSVSLNALTIGGSGAVTLTNASASTLTIASLNVTSGNLLTGSSVNLIITNGNVASGKQLSIGSSRTLTVNGTLTLNGTGPCCANKPLDNLGTITVPGGGLINYTGGSGIAVASYITVQAGGELRLSGSGSPTLGGSNTINGTLTIGGTISSIASSPTPSYGSGSLLQYAGSSLQTATFREWPSSNGPTNVTVNNSAGVNFDANLGLSPTVSGTLTLQSGKLDMKGAYNTLTFQDGNTPIVKVSGTLNVEATNYIYFGTSGHTGGTAFTLPDNLFFAAAPTFYNLSVNRANPLTLNNQNITLTNITSSLTVTSGLLILGTGNVKVEAISITVPSATKMIVTGLNSGYLIKNFTAANTALFTFPIGDNVSVAEYTPATIVFSANSIAREIGVKVIDDIHPEMNNPAAATDYISRYFSFYDSQSGNGTYGYDATIAYASADVNGTESSMAPVIWNNSAWLGQGLGSVNTAANIITFSALTQGTGPLGGNDFSGRTGALANDEPCGAVALSVGANCLTAYYTLDNATFTTNPPDPWPTAGCADLNNGGDVWFKVTVPASGSVTIAFEVSSGFSDGEMAVYTASNCSGTFTRIACDDDGNSAPNDQMPLLALTGRTPGETLYVRFWRFNGVSGGDFGVCAYEPQAPVNDNICSALTLNFGTTAYTNVGATAEVNEPVPPNPSCSSGWCPSDLAVQNSVWYTFTLAEAKKISITTTGFDNQIALYAATSCAGSFTLMSANDDYSGSAAGIASVCLTSGKYYVQIDGSQGAGGSGNITLAELATTPPVAISAISAGCASFTARWNSVAGASAYYLDVATDALFTNTVGGFGNYNAGTNLSVNVTGLAPGTTYYYRVRVNDGCGTSSNSNIITAGTFSGPSAAFTSSVNGNVATFTNTSANATSYTWDFGDGNNSTATSPSHTYAGAGNYTVTLTATNACGSNTAVDAVSIACVSVSVAIAANGATIFCNGGSVELAATTPVAGYTLQWSKDAQPISAAVNSSYFATATGSYTLAVDDGNGCTGNSNIVAVTVNPAPAVGIQANGNTTFCLGDSVALEATGTGTSYQWKRNNTDISGATGSIYYADDAFSYSVEVSDANGCTATSGSIAPAINYPPAAPSLISGPNVLCEGSAASYSVTPEAGATYVWTLPSGWTGSSNTASIGVQAGSASGNVEVVAGNNCGSSAPASASVIVNLNPLVTLAAFDTTCNTVAPFALGGGNPVGGDYYVNGAPAITFDPSAHVGGNIVTYQYEDGSGCSETATADLFVEVCSGINEVKEEFVVYPNPASEFVKVVAPAWAEDYTVNIYDAVGRKVISAEPTEYSAVFIDIRTLENGVYVAEIRSQKQLLLQRKLAVVR